MKPASQKFFAILVATCYFTTQVALGSIAESNFWAERKRTVVPPSLPTGIMNFSPAVSDVVSHPRLPASMRNLLESVSFQSASIQDVYDAKNGAPPLILLQDIHLNEEAQRNIAGVLTELMGAGKIGLIGVEGAFTPFDFSRVRAVSDHDRVVRVADEFLKQKKIAAHTYVGLTSKVEPPPVIGIDDVASYERNIRAYRDAMDRKEDAVRQLTADEQVLQARKQKNFNNELKTFDRLCADYRKGAIGIGVYTQRLAKIAPPTSLAIAQFLEAYETEQKINFEQVERERRIVLEALAKVLGKDELSDLVNQNVAYRMGRLSFGTYYENLRRTCERHGVSLAKTPAFASYVQYVLLADGIKASQLITDIRAWENEIVDRLAKTPEEKQLCRESELLSLTAKLVEFSMTAEEWKEYQVVIPAKDELKPFEDFYREADIRSEKMVGKFLSLRKEKATALITGGFHTAEITQLLRERQISYVVLSPKITHLRPEGCGGQAPEYLSVFAREKTPIEKLFSGHKLFLSPASVQDVEARPLQNAGQLIQEQLNKTAATDRELCRSLDIKTPGAPNAALLPLLTFAVPFNSSLAVTPSGGFDFLVAALMGLFLIYWLWAFPTESISSNDEENARQAKENAEKIIAVIGKRAKTIHRLEYDEMRRIEITQFAQPNLSAARNEYKAMITDLKALNLIPALANEAFDLNLERFDSAKVRSAINHYLIPRGFYLELEVHRMEIGFSRCVLLSVSVSPIEQTVRIDAHFKKDRHDIFVLGQPRVPGYYEQAGQTDRRRFVALTDGGVWETLVHEKMIRNIADEVFRRIEEKRPGEPAYSLSRFTQRFLLKQHPNIIENNENFRGNVLMGVVDEIMAILIATEIFRRDARFAVCLVEMREGNGWDLIARLLGVANAPIEWKRFFGEFLPAVVNENLGRRFPVIPADERVPSMAYLSPALLDAVLELSDEQLKRSADQALRKVAPDVDLPNGLLYEINERRVLLEIANVAVHQLLAAWNEIQAKIHNGEFFDPASLENQGLNIVAEMFFQWLSVVNPTGKFAEVRKQWKNEPSLSEIADLFRPGLAKLGIYLTLGKRLLNLSGKSIVSGSLSLHDIYKEFPLRVAEHLFEIAFLGRALCGFSPSISMASVQKAGPNVFRIQIQLSHARESLWKEYSLLTNQNEEHLTEFGGLPNWDKYKEIAKKMLRLHWKGEQPAWDVFEKRELARYTRLAIFHEIGHHIAKENGEFVPYLMELKAGNGWSTVFTMYIELLKDLKNSNPTAVPAFKRFFGTVLPMALKARGLGDFPVLHEDADVPVENFVAPDMLSAAFHLTDEDLSNIAAEQLTPLVPNLESAVLEINRQVDEMMPKSFTDNGGGIPISPSASLLPLLAFTSQPEWLTGGAPSLGFQIIFWTAVLIFAFYALRAAPGGDGPGEENKGWIAQLEKGAVYVHPMMGLVSIIEIFPDENKVNVRRRHVWGMVPQNIEVEQTRHQHLVGTTMVINPVSSDFVLYSKRGSNKVTKAGRAAHRARANVYHPECYMPLIVGFNGICNRLSADPKNSANYYDKLLGPDINGPLLWKKIGKKELSDASFRYFGEIFRKISFETGEDVIQTGALEAFGREVTDGYPHIWKLGRAFAQASTAWKPFKNTPLDISDYYREWLLRRGLRSLNTDNFVAITDSEYASVRNRFFFHFEDYLPKRNAAHDKDLFSQLILRQKRDFSITGQIYSLVQPRVKELARGAFSEVDLVVPAPSMNPITNQTIPLAEFVARELGKEMSLTGLVQIRKRKKQKKLGVLKRRAINAGGVFKGIADELKGKTVLIIDDNETTGFTALAMMAAAYESGAKKVLVASYGKTTNGQKNNVPTALAGEAERYTVIDLASRIIRSRVSTDEKLKALHLSAAAPGNHWEIDRDVLTSLESDEGDAVYKTDLLMYLTEGRAASLSPENQQRATKILIDIISKASENQRTKKDGLLIGSAAKILMSWKIRVLVDAPGLLKKIDLTDPGKFINADAFPALTELILKDPASSKAALPILCRNLAHLEKAAKHSPLVRDVCVDGIRRVIELINGGQLSIDGLDLAELLSSLKVFIKRSPNKRRAGTSVADVQAAAAFFQERMNHISMDPKPLVPPPAAPAFLPLLALVSQPKWLTGGAPSLGFQVLFWTAILIFAFYALRATPGASRFEPNDALSPSLDGKRVTKHTITSWLLRKAIEGPSQRPLAEGEVEVPARVYVTDALEVKENDNVVYRRPRREWGWPVLFTGEVRDGARRGRTLSSAEVCALFGLRPLIDPRKQDPARRLQRAENQLRVPVRFARHFNRVAAIDGDFTVIVGRNGAIKRVLFGNVAPIRGLETGDKVYPGIAYEFKGAGSPGIDSTFVRLSWEGFVDLDSAFKAIGRFAITHARISNRHNSLFKYLESRKFQVIEDIGQGLNRISFLLDLSRSVHVHLRGDGRFIVDIRWTPVWLKVLNRSGKMPGLFLNVPYQSLSSDYTDEVGGIFYGGAEAALENQAVVLGAGAKPASIGTRAIRLDAERGMEYRIRIDAPVRLYGFENNSDPVVFESIGDPLRFFHEIGIHTRAAILNNYTIPGKSIGKDLSPAGGMADFGELIQPQNPDLLIGTLMSGLLHTFFNLPPESRKGLFETYLRALGLESTQSLQKIEIFIESIEAKRRIAERDAASMLNKTDVGSDLAWQYVLSVPIHEAAGYMAGMIYHDFSLNLHRIEKKPVKAFGAPAFLPLLAFSTQPQWLTGSVPSLGFQVLCWTAILIFAFYALCATPGGSASAGGGKSPGQTKKIVRAFLARFPEHPNVSEQVLLRMAESMGNIGNLIAVLEDLEELLNDQLVLPEDIPLLARLLTSDGKQSDAVNMIDDLKELLETVLVREDLYTFLWPLVKHPEIGKAKFIEFLKPILDACGSRSDFTPLMLEIIGFLNMAVEGWSPSDIHSIIVPLIQLDQPDMWLGFRQIRNPLEAEFRTTTNPTIQKAIEHAISNYGPSYPSSAFLLLLISMQNFGVAPGLVGVEYISWAVLAFFAFYSLRVHPRLDQGGFGSQKKRHRDISHVAETMLPRILVETPDPVVRVDDIFGNKSLPIAVSNETDTDLLTAAVASVVLQREPRRIIPASAVEKPRVYVMKDRVAPVAFLTALLQTNPQFETTVYTAQENVEYYHTILLKAFPQAPFPIAILPTEINASTEGEIDAVSLQGIIGRNLGEVFLVLEGVALPEADQKRFAVMLFDLLVPLNTRQWNDLERIARRYLEAA